MHVLSCLFLDADFGPRAALAQIKNIPHREHGRVGACPTANADHKNTSSAAIQETENAVSGPQRYGKNYAGQWNCCRINTFDKAHEHLASCKRQQTGQERPEEAPGSFVGVVVALE